MPQNKHYRKGIHRKRWTCPWHKDGVRKTVVGKPCPTCGAMGKEAAVVALASLFNRVILNEVAEERFYQEGLKSQVEDKGLILNSLDDVTDCC